MDALVAEKVMGWKFKPPEGGAANWCQNCGRVMFAEGDGCEDDCFYSRDIASAWEVFDKIAELRIQKGHPAGDGRAAFYKPVIRLEWFEHDGEARVIIGRCKSAADDNDDNLIVCLHEGPADEEGPHGSAECLALVICRAALKAVL